MKRKIDSHLVTVIAVVTLLILGLACATKPKEVEPEVTWDESLTAGVTRITNDGIIKDSIAVSPDGTKLLYTEATKKDSNGNWAWNVICLRDANNPAKTPLITDFAFAPSWYEDNTRFLYISWEGGAGIMIRSNITGGGKTYITRTPIGNSDDTPSIKGGIIICSVWMNEKWQLVGVRENGTEPTFVGEGRWPSWHPTENKVVFIRNDDIYEMNIDSGYQVTQLYSDSKYKCYTPSYSPDGKRILFSKGTLTRVNAEVSTKKKTQDILGELERTHIFVMDADGSYVSPLSSGRASVSFPRWGRNNEIFCLVGSGNSKEIYKLRLRE